MPYGDYEGVQATRLTLAPGSRRAFSEQDHSGTIVVVSGKGRLIAESGSSQPLSEGDVGAVTLNRFTVANACNRSELRIILLRQ